MTNDKIALRELLEKGSDTTFLREMIGFAAQRLMELETDYQATSGTHPGSSLRTHPPCYCDASAGAGAGVALSSPERRFSRSR